MRKPTAKTVEEVNVYLEGLAASIPDTSTDNAIARFDGTGGALQGSGVTINDAGEIAASGVARSAAGATYDQWFVDGVRRFVVQIFPSSLGLFAADDSGVWSGGGGKKVWEIDRATGKVTLMQVGSTAGLEFGSSGPRMMMGTGGPSGISAPVGSTWRQTDANTSHGSLTGLLWNKVGTGTTEGTDWLVDFEGRWVSYTPSTTNVTLGTGGTVTGAYTRSGKTATVRARLVLGTSGSFSGTVGISLPATGATLASSVYAGNATMADSGVAGYYGFVVIGSGATTFTIVYTTTLSQVADYVGSGTRPFTWGANDNFHVQFTYEIA